MVATVAIIIVAFRNSAYNQPWTSKYQVVLFRSVSNPSGSSEN